MEQERGVFVHPTSVVDGEVTLGEGTKIWHFCHVGSGARLGKCCVLGQNVYVAPGVAVGDRVKLQNNVSVVAGVELSDGVFVGPSATFTNVLWPRAEIEKKSEFLSTHVGRGATVGANATIVCGTSIGAYAIVGAGSVVTRDVPAYGLVLGNPARLVGWVDEQGNRVDRAPSGASARAPSDNDLSERSLSLPSVTSENEPLQGLLEAAARRVLGSGHFILGPEVEAFERAASRYLGVQHAVAVSSGSDALLASLMALGVGPGDEVITTPFSFFATVGCILRLGATPVFVDIDDRSFHLDLARVEAALTPRTRVFLPVHLFGQCLDWSKIGPLLAARGVAVVEDAAQAFGARGADGVRLGSTDSLTCFSFFPSKNLGGFGDGGLITTNDSAWADRLRAVRAHGAAEKNDHRILGGNFRMHALQAALLNEKLPFLDGFLAARRERAALYDAHFERFGDRLTRPGRTGPDHTYNQYVVRHEQRDRLVAALGARGISTPVYYPRTLVRQPALAHLGLDPADFPRAERASREVFSLPVHPSMSLAEVNRVAEIVTESLNEF